MPLLILFLATSVVFLIADAIMLGLVIKPLFQKNLGDTMLQSLRVGPAVAFYLIYMCGVMYFAAWPAFKAGDANPALLNGLILGLVAYGCYELTSFTVMRDWVFQMAATDMIWGGVVTAASAWIGVKVALAVAG